MLVAIHRPTWHRGQGSSTSALLTNAGKRCCLGFAGKKLGFSDKELLNVQTPSGLRWETYLYMPGLVNERGNTPTCSDLMYVNDKEELPEREALLKKHAREAGYRFIFTNSRLLTWVINVWFASPLDRINHETIGQ